MCCLLKAETQNWTPLLTVSPWGNPAVKSSWPMFRCCTADSDELRSLTVVKTAPQSTDAIRGWLWSWWCCWSSWRSWWCIHCVRWCSAVSLLYHAVMPAVCKDAGDANFFSLLKKSSCWWALLTPAAGQILNHVNAKEPAPPQSRPCLSLYCPLWVNRTHWISPRALFCSSSVFAAT